MGLHAGWNILQRSLGFPLSGYELSRLLKINVSGPELWTGGAFGPEAGLIILPISGLGALLIHRSTRQRERAADPDLELRPRQQPAHLA